MNPYHKLIITIVSIGITILLGFAIENKRKRILFVMLILLAISMASNRSFYWIVYWDGPYHGQVVDADTGKPIEGASVAGIWMFEYLHIKSSVGFANARETVTEANGRFTIPLTFAFTFWPFSSLEDMDLVVFKTGYDSHPPVIRRTMKKPEGIEHQPTDGKYFVGRRAHCKAWRECEIRLNKAITIEEKRQAVAQCGSRLGAMGIKLSKVYNFLKVIEKENPNLKYLE